MNTFFLVVAVCLFLYLFQIKTVLAGIQRVEKCSEDQKCNSKLFFFYAKFHAVEHGCQEGRFL